MHTAQQRQQLALVVAANALGQFVFERNALLPAQLQIFLGLLANLLVALGLSLDGGQFAPGRLQRDIALGIGIYSWDLGFV